MRNLILVLIVAIALTGFGAFAQALTSVPYGAHNRDHDGSGWLIAREDPETAQGPDPLYPVAIQHARLAGLDPESYALVIVAPQTAYRDSEVDALSVFLHAGGRALIADEAGAGRHLVDRLDLGVEISRGPVFSTGYREDPMRPLALPTGRIDGLPDPMEMPRTHAVLGTGAAVLRVHELSWLDLDHDGQPALDDPQGPFALARVLSVGDGELLVMGAPLLFARAPGTGDPQEAHTARSVLLDWLTRGDRTLVLDESKRASADPFDLAKTLSQDPALAHALAAIGLAVFLVAAVWGVRLQRVRPPRPRPAHQETRDPVLRAALQELPAS